LRTFVRPRHWYHFGCGTSLAAVAGLVFLFVLFYWVRDHRGLVGDVFSIPEKPSKPIPVHSIVAKHLPVGTERSTVHRRLDNWGFQLSEGEGVSIKDICPDCDRQIRGTYTSLFRFQHINVTVGLRGGRVRATRGYLIYFEVP
jgi:hypothetical protein